jgi:hypothetical protein
MTDKDTYDQTVSRDYLAPARDEEAIRLSDLAALVQMGLGHPLDPLTFKELAQIQADLRGTQRALAIKLDTGALTPESYLDQLNAALSLWAKRNLALLGDEMFDAIFGKEGRQPEDMIDRGTFLGYG